MPEVIMKLHKLASSEDAARVVDDIRNSGEISYVDASGSTVNVTVGDVSVEEDTA